MTRRLAFFVSSFLVILFASCSQVAPDVLAATSTMIYEYDDEESLPQERLCVFVEASSDTRRCDTLEVICHSNDYHWSTDEIVLYEKGQKYWAGYTNFVMPEQESFSEGLYTVIYTDAAENEQSEKFYVSKNRSIEEMKSQALLDVIKDYGFAQNWAVYDEDDKLVFYGPRKENLYTIENVWKKYQNASYVRSVFVKTDKTIIVLLPKTNREQ